MNRTPVIDNNWIDVACIGAPVPHKNFDIIPAVLDELQKAGIDNVRFHTTIPNSHPILREITKRITKTRHEQNLINHGSVSQKELSEIYCHCQLCFLPTLLEVFSASSLEAMFFRLPTIASNFPFNTEVLSDACLYYAPGNAQSAAQQFSVIIHDHDLQNGLRAKMEKLINKYENYDRHFETIKNFLIKVAQEESNPLCRN